MLKMRGREKLLISGVNGDGSTALYLAAVDFSPSSPDLTPPICVSGSICPGCKTNCQIVAIPQHNTGLAFSVVVFRIGLFALLGRFEVGSADGLARIFSWMFLGSGIIAYLLRHGSV